MKIQIKSIQKTENGLMVECLTIIGIVKGIWKGNEEIVRVFIILIICKI